MMKNVKTAIFAARLHEIQLDLVTDEFHGRAIKVLAWYAASAVS